MNSKFTKSSLFLLLMIFSCITLFAQKTVTGRVVNDETKEPLQGVTVGIKGSKKTTITDSDGRFSIPVSGNESVLKFTSIGFGFQEINVGNKNELSISLAKESKQLEDVVIIGYGEQSKKKVLGSVASINVKDIEDLPVSNLGAALQGRFPGISVSGGTERPGANATITVRNPVFYAKNSVQGANPLYVIDDVVRSIDDFNTLDPSEIESLSILKDAAASIYGARSGNGVVLIKTKRGKAGKTQFNFNSSIAFNDAYMLPKMMNGYQLANYLNASQQGQRNYVAAGTGGYLDQTAYYTQDELDYFQNNNTDWLGMGWKPSTFTRHALNISGGSDRATFFAGLSYVKQDGNLPNINISKWTFRASADFKVTNSFSAGISLSGDLSKNNQYLLKTGGENPENDMKGLLYTPGFSPAYINGYPVRLSQASNQNTIDAYHFFEIQRLNNYNRSRNNGLNVQANLNYAVPFIKGLSAKVMFSKTLENTFPKQFGTTYKLYQFRTTGGHGHLYTDTVIGNVTVTNGNRVYFKPSYSDAYQFNAYLTFNRKFGRHSINAIAVVEQSESEYDDVQAYTDAPTEGAPDIQRFAFGANNIFETAREDGRLGYIGRLNYGFADKYLAEVTVRRDASTLFAPGKRWGTFPALMLGWVISEEKFFRKVTAFNYLKLRGSVGHLGSDNTQEYRYLLRYTVGATSGAVFGNNLNRSVGTKVEELANPEAVWDDAIKYNVGIDAAFLQNRLTASIEGYHNHLYNQLTSLSASVPLLIGASIGAENYSTTNTFGYEISLGWKDNFNRNLTYYVNPFFAWSDAKVIKTDIAAGDIGSYRDITGRSNDLGFLGLHYLGMFRTDAEVADFLAKNPGYTIYGQVPKRGMLYYQDIRGPKGANNVYAGPDGKIDDNDMDYLTKKASNHYGFGASMGIGFKGLRLDIVISGAFGGQGSVEGAARKLGTATSSRPVFWTDAYSVDNTEAKYPNPFFSSTYDVASDFWFRSSTSFRMRSANLSYTIPSRFIKAIGSNGLKVYMTATNPINFYNPYKEYKDNSGSFDSYPTLRTFAFGINATF